MTLYEDLKWRGLIQDISDEGLIYGYKRIIQRNFKRTQY